MQDSKLGYDQSSKLGYNIVQLCRAHRTTAGALLSKLGLHPGQEIILMHLWKKDGQSQKQLAELLYIQAPTVTKMLQRLEQTGILERRPSSTDHRVMHVWLTQSGKDLESKVSEVWAELEQRTQENLSQAEQRAFQEIIQKVLLGLRNANSKDMACSEASE